MLYLYPKGVTLYNVRQSESLMEADASLRDTFKSKSDIDFDQSIQSGSALCGVPDALSDLERCNGLIRDFRPTPVAAL